MGFLGDAEAVQLFQQEAPVGRVECQPPYRRFVESSEAVEHRGFAGAVRTYDGRDQFRRRSERDVVDGHEAAEPHGQVLDRKQGLHAGSGLHRYHRFVSRGLPPAGCRRIVGSRCASRPPGFQTMISTMPMPKASMRYSDSSRNNSGTPMRTAAASTMPTWLPSPPRTTMARMIADSRKTKLSGLIKALRTAKKDPAKPPNMAPTANAVSFVFVGLMPSARQAVSSSRNASQARPSGSLRMRSVKKFTASAANRTR